VKATLAINGYWLAMALAVMPLATFIAEEGERLPRWPHTPNIGRYADTPGCHYATAGRHWPAIAVIATLVGWVIGYVTLNTLLPPLIRLVGYVGWSLLKALLIGYCHAIEK